ncbi:MAG: hypothetical protein IJK04_06910, partial [Kiritimatiellae bacterium]|nr:hypothetical protein [Kiritimatiellia bacterium]
ASGVAVNTVFSCNVLASGTLQDIKDTTAPAMTNCLYSVLSGDLPTSASGCVHAADPGFADAAAGDYTPAWKSPLRNAAWSNAAYLLSLGPVDLAGNPRVYIRDGQGVLDIGCLENQMKSKALRVYVR